MFKDEHPRHRVRITRPFYMATTEVTEEQYDAVTGIANRYPRGATHPRTEVIWDGAAFFCSRLSERTGRTVSLPTEAQWEYACRAGTATPFYTGETITTEQANYNGSYVYGNGQTGVYRGEAMPVGSFLPNAWGLYDMHGNVHEWCKDWYGRDYYANTDVDDPQGPRPSGARLFRGGSWRGGPGACRSASRTLRPGTRGASTIGFRIVVDVE